MFELPAQEAGYVGICDLTEYVKQVVKEHQPGPFKPHSWYNVDGNILEIYWRSDSCYGEPIFVDDKEVMTLMRSQETGEVVGVTVPHVLQLMGLRELKQ